MQDPWAFEFASDNLKNNRNVVLTVVMKHGGMLQFASEELRGDEQICDPNFYSGPYCFISDKLLGDRNYVMKWVDKGRGGILEVVSENLRNDEELATLCVNLNHNMLEYAPYVVRNDPSVVLPAVKKYGCNLQYASDKCKNNETIVLEAALENLFALSFASAELRDDADFIFKIMKEKDPFAIRHASERIRDDKTFLLEAFKQLKPKNGVMYYVTDKAKEDEFFVEQCWKTFH